MVLQWIVCDLCCIFCVGACRVGAVQVVLPCRQVVDVEIMLRCSGSSDTTERYTSLTRHFADRVVEAIGAKNSRLVVGLDPVYEKLPGAVKAEAGAGVRADCAAQARSLSAYGGEVIRATADHAVAVKLNIAFYERLGAAGVDAYYEILEQARRCGILTICDAKRSDIPSTNEQYAAALLADRRDDLADGVMNADSMTVVPWFGVDSLNPFFDVCRAEGKGLFVVVRATNPESSSVQSFAGASGALLFEHVADDVTRAATDEGLVGDSGYSCVGAVVGSTDQAAAASLRTRMPRCIFLVPGVGAQGGSMAAVASAIGSDGCGALINASRSIMYAWVDSDGVWTDAVGRAAEDLKTRINESL